MNREKFETLVTEALDSLPDEFTQKLENVEVVVEDWPTREQLRTSGVGRGMTLFGLYQGIPQTRRQNYTAVLPDKITIFAGPILNLFGQNVTLVRDQVRKTVIHEIGHHFGMDEVSIRQAQNKK
ncbi:TPA: hypothetical protein DIV55_03820 [Patescibacteria group bacterium]|uniref:Metallopeptidase family protein n=1 Tax=Candidatus Gottesmanbacteria bacterium GW2011_GWA1_43_11 TaxID=1618436 RepID=A0A0G1ER04_9BACT|nr:MAG: hypothetical protein UV59_C0007G0064 [Candidatus Gottesmanbacteria bacterium GW2011_GWA1_43_11]HCS78847.1 hypothetical protein [Patescibacteria group bacterium]